jgi:hypothetical protein
VELGGRRPVASAAAVGIDESERARTRAAVGSEIGPRVWSQITQGCFWENARPTCFSGRREYNAFYSSLLLNLVKNDFSLFSSRLPDNSLILLALVENDFSL